MRLSMLEGIILLCCIAGFASMYIFTFGTMLVDGTTKLTIYIDQFHEGFLETWIFLSLILSGTFMICKAEKI